MTPVCKLGTLYGTQGTAYAKMFQQNRQSQLANTAVVAESPFYFFTRLSLWDVWHSCGLGPSGKTDLLSNLVLNSIEIYIYIKYILNSIKYLVSMNSIEIY